MTKECNLQPLVIATGVSVLVSLITLLNRPSVANIRTVDIVHLITTGVALGAFLVSLGIFFIHRRSH